MRMGKMVTKQKKRTFVSNSEVSGSQLVITRTTETYEAEYASSELVSKKVLKMCNEKEVIAISNTDMKELSMLRKSGVPTFIVKPGNLLYKSSFPVRRGNYESFTLDGTHMCFCGKHICARLSALPDPWGCEKVRNCATGIELYPFITGGYEIFGTSHDVFCVTRCENYIPRTNKRILEKPLGVQTKNLEDLYNLVFG